MVCNPVDCSRGGLSSQRMMEVVSTRVLHDYYRRAVELPNDSDTLFAPSYIMPNRFLGGGEVDSHTAAMTATRRMPPTTPGSAEV